MRNCPKTLEREREREVKEWKERKEEEKTAIKVLVKVIGVVAVAENLLNGITFPNPQS